MGRKIILNGREYIGGGEDVSGIVDSLNTTEQTPRNIADVLAEELARIAENILQPNAEIDNSASHNAIYRGKYLGTAVTAEQYSAINDGTFKDLFIGDYWTINGVNWRIAHFDYWLNTGDTNCTTHHVVIVPDTNLYNAQMNSENPTTGGYYNSAMRGGANYPTGGNLANAKTAIDNAFGSSHILSHREILTNAISSNIPSGWDWYNSTVDLMSEVMAYGHHAWSANGGDGSGFETGIDHEQLALFRHDHSRICTRAHWWLRGCHNLQSFAIVNANGRADYAHSVNYSLGVRPAFAIRGGV